jgi:type II secretory pathway pseudopilin PulG
MPSFPSWLQSKIFLYLLIPLLVTIGVSVGISYQNQQQAQQREQAAEEQLKQVIKEQDQAFQDERNRQRQIRNEQTPLY